MWRPGAAVVPVPADWHRPGSPRTIVSADGLPAKTGQNGVTTARPLARLATGWGAVAAFAVMGDAWLAMIEAPVALALAFAALFAIIL